MKVLGWQTMTVTGTSTATSSLPLYLDFYLTVDVSGSMGLPSTPAEAIRMQSINPDNFVQYPTGCTLVATLPAKQRVQGSSVTSLPIRRPIRPTNSAYTQRYNTNNYCMGYSYSRVSQSALANLIVWRRLPPRRSRFLACQNRCLPACRVRSTTILHGV